MESEKRVFTGLKEGKCQCFRVESRMRDELNFFSVIGLGANGVLKRKIKSMQSSMNILNGGAHIDGNHEKWKLLSMKERIQLHM